MTDFVDRARSLVAERFPQTVAAFLGGSAASGTSTETSDLDLLVVLPEAWADVSYVETTTYEGQLVQAFVYGPVALQGWLEKGRRNRRPVLDKLIGEGIALTASAGGPALQKAARTALSEGPAPLTGDELQQRRYSLSAVLDDLADATEPGETFVLSATAWREAAELALLIDRRWLGSGKWLLREMRLQPDRFSLVAWVSNGQADGDVGALLIACKSVLMAAGGYLQDGFVHGVRPA